ncbi:MAG: glycosyltransferase family 4 protein [Bacteroidota bacterium]
MRIVHVSFFYDERLTTEEELLEQHYTITGWAEALQRRGAEVIVMSRFIKDSSLQKNNVQYYFRKDNLGGVFRSWRLPFTFLRQISKLDADVIHLHNFTLSLQNFLLRLLLAGKTAVIIQHHGGPLPGIKKRSVHNLLNNVADGFFFTTIEQGKEWFIKKKQSDKIMPVMEGSTFFNYADRDAASTFSYQDRSIARKKTGMSGTPVFLWVGRLDDNKDPLTVLEGFATLSEKYPGAGLYMIYSDDKLSGEVKKKISGSAILNPRVHLLGKIEHPQMETYYSSADYFVLGSHYEGSGYALSEALRCGCIPVITNIPSFRMMTNDGQLGALWETGNKNSFIEAVTMVLSKPLATEANACIVFFRKALSFDAIAGVAMHHYGEVMKARSKK